NGHSASGVPGTSNTHSRSIFFSLAHSAGHGCNASSFSTLSGSGFALASTPPTVPLTPSSEHEREDPAKQAEPSAAHALRFLTHEPHGLGAKPRPRKPYFELGDAIRMHLGAMRWKAELASATDIHRPRDPARAGRVDARAEVGRDRFARVVHLVV